MPAFDESIDILLVVLTYVATVAGLLYFVFCTTQQNVRRNQALITRVVLRVLVVVSVVAVLCWLTETAFWLVITIFVIGFLTAAMLQGPIGFLAMPLMILLWLTKEFILGYQELSELTLTNPEPMPEEQRVDPELAALVGRQSSTESALNPQGTINFDGRSFPAASANGTWIDAGVLVSVIEACNGKLLVREIEYGG